MEVSEFLELVENLHGDARERGLYFQACSDESLRGRTIHVGGRELLNFGSCSYLGLEYHPKLVAAAKDALDRYGTQFASSRGYMSAPPYPRLEALLSEIFGAHALVAQTTTLGHQAAFDALITEKDAVVLDHHAHFSMQRAATLVRAAGAHIELVRHHSIADAEPILDDLSRRYRRVWFVCDGVTSMYGELAPVELLQRFQDVADNVYLYVDDAHGMSWDGKHGRGNFLNRMPMNERMVVAVSLAKAFGVGGGALVFPTEQLRDQVRLTGGAMVFSGPLQPPLLGAATASAELHLTDEIIALQRALALRVDYTNRRIGELGLPLLAHNEAPIFFVRLGYPHVAKEVAQRMLKDGIYANISMFPSVPQKRSGIRLAVTVDHSFAQIDRYLDRLSHHLTRVLKEERIGRNDIEDLFDIDDTQTGQGRSAQRKGSRFVRALLDNSIVPRIRRSAPGRVRKTGSDNAAGITLEHRRSITELDREEWDRLLGSEAACSWDSMRVMESLFRGRTKKEHNWEFHYFVARDGEGEVVAAAPFTLALQKDDMLMRQEVSREVERRRADEPYFLTSLVLTMGSNASEGRHLYLNRDGPWRPAMTRMLREVRELFEKCSADLLVLRDFSEDDPELDAFFDRSGLVKAPMLDSHIVDVDWTDLDGFVTGLGKRKRQFMRGVLKTASEYDMTVYARTGGERSSLEPGLAQDLDRLYNNVADRNMRLNTFRLPEDFAARVLESESWEVVVLRTAGPDGGQVPVSWYAAHRTATDYAPFCCGIDYDYVYNRRFGAYRQLLLRMVERGTDLGVERVHLGMDADVEKRRFGSVPRKTCVYVYARGDFETARLQQIVADVGLAPPDAHRPSLELAG